MVWIASWAFIFRFKAARAGKSPFWKASIRRICSFRLLKSSSDSCARDQTFFAIRSSFGLALADRTDADMRKDSLAPAKTEVRRLRRKLASELPRTLAFTRRKKRRWVDCRSSVLTMFN